MYKLVETKLQKVILLIGGLLIFFRLLDIGYYERYNTIFTSVGIFILTTVFLIILRDYHPKFHFKILEFAKKHKHSLIYIAILIFLIILIWISWIWYSDVKEKKIIKMTKEQFHNSEIAYQNCLDKIAVLTTWKIEPVDKSDGYIHLYDTITTSQNKYFDEWIESGRPNYNQREGHWEWAFMYWMMGKHSEFCKEFNIDLIDYFLINK
jgi:hypothetical protein